MEILTQDLFKRKTANKILHALYDSRGELFTIMLNSRKSQYRLVGYSTQSLREYTGMAHKILEKTLMWMADLKIIHIVKVKKKKKAFLFYDVNLHFHQFVLALEKINGAEPPPKEEFNKEQYGTILKWLNKCYGMEGLVPAIFRWQYSRVAKMVWKENREQFFRDGVKEKLVHFWSTLDLLRWQIPQVKFKSKKEFDRWVKNGLLERQDQDDGLVLYRPNPRFKFVWPAILALQTNPTVRPPPVWERSDRRVI